MEGLDLYQKWYREGLVRNGVDNVVFRTYEHVKNDARDKATAATGLVFSPRSESVRRLRALLAASDGKHGVALTSLVGVGADLRRLLLLDCRLPASPENDGALVDALREAQHDLPALYDCLVLRTARSYHIAAFPPLDEQEWRRHMTRALLLQTKDGTPIVDARYVGHSLGRGYGSLRLGPYGDKPAPTLLTPLHHALADQFMRR